MADKRLQQKFKKVQLKPRHIKLEIPNDWKIKKIDESFEFLRTGTNSRSDLEKNGDIHYIHYGDIHTKWNSVLDCDSEEIPCIDKTKVEEITLLKDGDLIIADASEDYEGSGTSILLKNVKSKKIVSGLHTIALRSKDENISFDFEAFLTSIRIVKKQIISYVTGISVYGLSKKSLKEVAIPFPPLPEQQKIASILNNVDDSIQKTAEQIEKTKQLKEGIEQFIFHKGIKQEKTQKIKTKQGKSLQFPISWKLSKIKQIAKFSSGEFLPEHSQQNGKIPVYGGNGITGYHNEFLIDFKTVVIGRVGAYCGNAYLTELKSWITDNAIFVKEIHKKFNMEYLFRFISRLNIRLLAEVSAQPKITQNILENITIWYPNDPIEQQKIAYILSNIDSQIESLQSKNYNVRINWNLESTQLKLICYKKIIIIHIIKIN